MTTPILSRAFCAAVFAVVFAPAIGAEPTMSLLIRAHHGAPAGDAATIAADPVEQLMQITNEACLVRGDDAEALKTWAANSHWTPATADALAAIQDRGITQVVGGWTVASDFGATAIIQSEFRPPESGHVCSVTTQLPANALHPDAKSAFKRQFNTDIAEEHDSPDQHTDRYWIKRDRKLPVKASIVFTHSRRLITIRMIHGRKGPLDS